MNTRYKTYAEIPPITVDMILGVTGARHIFSIPLEDIGGFMDGLEQYYNTMENENVRHEA